MLLTKATKNISFSSLPKQCFYTTWQNMKPGNCIFSHCQQTYTICSDYHQVTAAPSFIYKIITCMQQTWPMKGSTICAHTLITYQVCRNIDCCVKNGSGSCFSFSLEWKSLSGWSSICPLCGNVAVHDAWRNRLCEFVRQSECEQVDVWPAHTHTHACMHAHIRTHIRFMALWTLSRITRVSRYQKQSPVP